MKKLIGILVLSLFLGACQKSEPVDPALYSCDLGFADSSANHPHNAEYQAILDQITASGVVGISLSACDPQNGMWLGTSGKADLQQNISIQPCNVFRVGSTVKMFTATLIFMLQEEGKLDLDDKISTYLSGDPVDQIEQADEATVRQLLQHSSGIYNYIQDLKFQTASLNDLIREWKAEDLLAYAYHKSAYFKPDEDVVYSNTGYILLGLLIEKIEGKPLYQVYEEKIFRPLGMNFTLFAGKDPVPDGIVRGYIDLYSNLQVIESTYYSGWDYYTADGGLISNPYDLSIFFQALMSGKILNAASMNEMLTFREPRNPDPEFFPIAYGLGIFKIETPRGTAYMHSGDAIGYYANMMYFPADSSTIVYAVNSNYGKIDAFVSTRNAMEQIIEGIKAE